MEIPDFEFFVDREKNKPCLIGGTAPSIMKFPFDRFKGKYILAGEGPQILERLISPDYWVVANNVFPVPEEHKRVINRYKDSVFVFSDTVAYSKTNRYDRNLLKEIIKTQWFAFDERHFKGKKCTPLRDCCKLVDLYPGRATLQEFVERHFGVKDIWHGSGTAAIYSLMFAVIMGCSPIYLQGIELPIYAKDYLYSNTSPKQAIKNLCSRSKAYLKGKIYGEPVYAHFYYCMKETLATFEGMVNICHKRGIEIYNLSPTSSLNMIKALPYLDYRKVCA